MQLFPLAIIIIAIFTLATLLYKTHQGGDDFDEEDFVSTIKNK